MAINEPEGGVRERLVRFNWREEAWRRLGCNGEEMRRDEGDGRWW